MWLTKTKLSRITDGKQIIPEIEGLRFIAVILVILSHINNILLKLYPQQLQYYSGSRLGIFLEECGAGVQVFFFISGFILAVPFLQSRIYHKNKVSVKHYFYRRLTRIEPPYLISLLFFFFSVLLFMHEPFGYLLEHFFASALYVHNIVYNDISRINPVAWSLEVEVQYYLLFPLIAFCLFIKNNITRRLLLICFFIAASCIYSFNISFFEKYHLSKSVIAYLHVFTTGIIAAEIYLSAGKFFSSGKYYLFDILGLIALYCCIVFSGYQAPLYKIFLFICYLVFFSASFKGRIFNKILTNDWIVIIGGMCYSIYLLHYAVIFFIQNYFTHHFYTYRFTTDVLVQTILILPFVLIAGGLFFVLFERPFMDIRWPQKWKKTISGFIASRKESV